MGQLVGAKVESSKLSENKVYIWVKRGGEKSWMVVSVYNDGGVEKYIEE